MFIQNSYRFVSAPSFDSDYQAVLDYAVLNSISLPSSSVKTAQNDLMISLKAAGLFSKMDVFHNFANNDTVNDDFKKICWVRLVSGYETVSGGLIFQEKGVEVQAAITSGNFSTDFNLNSGVNYLLNDAFYGNVIFESSGIAMSAVEGTTTRDSFIYNGSQKRINSSFSNLNSSVDIQGDTGLIGISRFDSSNVSVYQKSTEYQRTQSSGTLTNGNYNISHYRTNESDQVVSCTILGSSFTLSNITAFRSSYNSYLLDIGLTQYA
jgi:hypothetical protein